MTKRVINSYELAAQLVKVLQNSQLLPPDDGSSPNPVTQSVLDLLASKLVKAGFPDRDVQTKRITILLSDIRGFSAIAEAHPARDVVALLNRYFARMGDIIAEHGGAIDKLMGDSILVVFGLPTHNDDDVQQAIACAVEMQLAMADLNQVNQGIGMPDIYQGIGINTGNVVVGDLGSHHYNEYTVIGDEVNLVSRIESHCLRGQILISENTYQIAKDYIQVSKPNVVEIKGAGQAVALYEVFAIDKPVYMEVPRREGRKSPRVPASMPLTFQSLNGKIVQPEKYRGQVVDISYHGMLMESDIKLGRLSEIKMTLALELFGDRTTDVYARIINSEALGDTYRSSLEFTGINREGQTAIKQYVDQVVASS